MAIPTILKGDTPAPICFTAPETAARLLAKYQGVVRTFEHVAQGDQLSIRFTAEESAAFKLGTSPIYFAAGYADGRVKTYPISAKIKVTDSPALVYGSTLDMDPGADGGKPLDGVDALPELHTMDDMAAKLNEIIHKLGGGAAAILLTLCLSALGASVQTAPLGSIRNDAQVVTNVTFSGLAPADYETVSNRAMSALQQHQSLMPATIYADEATNALSRAMRDKSDLAVYKVQTNYTDWVFSDGQTRDVIIIEDSPYPDLPWLITGSDYNSLPYMESFHPTREAAEAALEFSYPLYDNTSGEYVDIIATREARVTMVQNGRIATRTDATAAAAAAVLPIEQEIADMRAENSLIYRLYSGSNVVCEVTNYNSRVNPPTLRLLQFTETNTYITIWAETNGLERTVRSAAAYTDSAVAELEARAREAYAPRGWSGTTSGLGAPAPSNTTWISTPTTVFAGGLEYEKQVTTFGQIWILSYHGDTPQVYTNQASNITLMSADGTEAFAVEKTDSYLVGVDATSIHVNGNTVTMAVPVVAETHPYLRYTQALSPLAWEREENGFTTDISVTWSGSSGAWVCTVTTSARQGFFAFEFFQEGGVKVTSKGTFDIPDGILCTDGVHKCRPVYNNGTITWEAFQ